ncbi:MAG: hypothetical protein AB7T37_06775 [Dehalococcoidia bacterium]
MNEQLASGTARVLRTLGVDAWEADTGGGLYTVTVAARDDNGYRGSEVILETDGFGVEPENRTYAHDQGRLRLAGCHGGVAAFMPVDEDNPRAIAAAILWDLAQRARNAELGVNA